MLDESQHNSVIKLLALVSILGLAACSKPDIKIMHSPVVATSSEQVTFTAVSDTTSTDYEIQPNQNGVPVFASNTITIPSSRDDGYQRGIRITINGSFILKPYKMQFDGVFGVNEDEHFSLSFEKEDIEDCIGIRKVCTRVHIN